MRAILLVALLVTGCKDRDKGDDTDSGGSDDTGDTSDSGDTGGCPTCPDRRVPGPDAGGRQAQTCEQPQPAQRSGTTAR